MGQWPREQSTDVDVAASEVPPGLRYPYPRGRSFDNHPDGRCAVVLGTVTELALVISSPTPRYTDAIDDQVLPVTDVYMYGGFSIIQTL